MRYIIKLSTPRGDRYLEWSTIVDAPVTYGMPLDEFTAYYRDQYGAEGMRALPERMARVEAKGTSDRISRDVADTVCCGAMTLDELRAFAGMSDDERRAHHAADVAT